MTKVGIILYQNKRFAPFCHAYLDLLSKNNISTELIYLDRKPELGEANNSSNIPIKWVKLKIAKKIEKEFNAFVFFFKAIPILIRKKYDYLVVLTTMPGVILSPLLLTKYKKKYIIDIRDYTKESSSLYYAIEKSVIKNSIIAAISSPGFKNFLPEHEYFIYHNINPGSYSGKHYSFDHHNGSKQITIGYIGSIQYIPQCLKLIDLVYNDPRFNLVFWGDEPVSNAVSNEIARRKSSRLVFNGVFLYNEKEAIYNKVDIVFNCYGSASPVVKNAISNKYYDAAYYKKPLLLSPNTIMENLLKEYAFSIDFDNTSSLDDLWNWFQNLNKDSFDSFADAIVSSALSENTHTEQAIISALTDRNFQ